MSTGCGIFGYRVSRWHLAASWLFVQVTKSKISFRIIKLIIYFHSNGKCMVSVEGEVSMLREIKASVPQDFVLFAYNVYVNDVHLNTRHLYARSLPMTAKTAVLWENCNTVSCQEGHSVTSRTLKPMNIRPRPPVLLLRTNIPFVKRQISRCNLWNKDYTQNPYRKDLGQGLVCCLFKSQRLSANITLTYHKAQRLTACPAWEFAANAHLLKRQCLWSKVRRMTANSLRRTRTHNLHLAFKILCVYKFVTKLCRQRAEVIPTREWKCSSTPDKANPNIEITRIIR